MRWSVVASPIGDLGVAAEDSAVCAVSFSGPPPGVRVVAEPTGVLADAVRQLRAYLAGELTEFSVPLSVRRGSGFERAVWREIVNIPYGETRTYGEVATAVGDPAAARAVGVACNRNPIPVIVPCHRIVGAGNKLVGFGGGLHRKRFLLELEARARILRDFGQ